jgi:membrane fusion protein (multidrug efflux system)
MVLGGVSVFANLEVQAVEPVVQSGEEVDSLAAWVSVYSNWRTALAPTIWNVPSRFIARSKEKFSVISIRKWFQVSMACGLALACLFAAGCKSKLMGPPMGPVQVSVIKLQPQQLQLSTELPGRITAYLTAEIRPQVNGIVLKRLFQEGALVHAGQILYQIDPSSYQASLAQARANLASAEANLPSLQAKADRYRDLAAIHAVGQQDYEDAVASLKQAQATVESDKAAVESARINLAYTPITAPITGRIGKSSVTVGGLVSSYQTTVLATVQQIEPVYVDVVQANADLLRLRTRLANGQLKSSGAQENKVKLYLEDGSLYPIEGKLDFRDVTVDTTTGSVTVRMTFANPKQILLPGMYVRAVVQEGIRPDALLLPQQAVSRDPKGLPFVWVIGADGKADRRMIEVDRAIGSQWLVNKGVSASEQVVMEGGDRLKVGMQVLFVPYKTDAAASGTVMVPQAASGK